MSILSNYATDSLVTVNGVVSFNYLSKTNGAAIAEKNSRSESHCSN
ncbi:hypothetical protein [Apilactobacillus ozensis]|nr:hypothetical protein [Apilactobacillus ozensis]